MPTYRYECRSCKKIHEFFQSMSEEPIKKCPSCGGRLDRLIGTGAGILLKGSGFHNTDYRSASYREAAKSESESAKSDTPAAKSEKTDSKSTSDAPKKEAAPKSESKPKVSKKKSKDN